MLGHLAAGRVGHLKPVSRRRRLARAARMLTGQVSRQQRVHAGSQAPLVSGRVMETSCGVSRAAALLGAMTKHGRYGLTGLSLFISSRKEMDIRRVGGSTCRQRRCIVPEEGIAAITNLVRNGGGVRRRKIDDYCPVRGLPRLCGQLSSLKGVQLLGRERLRLVGEVSSPPCIALRPLW